MVWFSVHLFPLQMLITAILKKKEKRKEMSEILIIYMINYPLLSILLNENLHSRPIQMASAGSCV